MRAMHPIRDLIDSLAIGVGLVIVTMLLVGWGSWILQGGDGGLDGLPARCTRYRIARDVLHSEIRQNRRRLIEITRDTHMLCSAAAAAVPCCACEPSIPRAPEPWSAP